MEIKVCIGTSCHLKGAYDIMTTFLQMIEKYKLHDKITVQSSFCTGECQKGVNVSVDGERYSVTSIGAKAFFVDTVLPMVK